MKLARDCAGDVVLLTISYVSLWVRQSTGDVIMCPPGKPVSLANATAVAAVGDKDECALCLLAKQLTRRCRRSGTTCPTYDADAKIVPRRVFNDARLLSRRGHEAGFVALASLTAVFVV